MEPLLVANDLDGHRMLGLVVEALDNLSERAFPNHLSDLVAVGDVVVEYLDVAAVVIIVAC